MLGRLRSLKTLCTMAISFTPFSSVVLTKCESSEVDAHSELVVRKHEPLLQASLAVPLPGQQTLLPRRKAHLAILRRHDPHRQVQLFFDMMTASAP